MKIYRYGMRLRGFSMGCQPMHDFYKREDSKDYYDEILYTSELTSEEIDHFSLDFLGVEEVTG